MASVEEPECTALDSHTISDKLLASRKKLVDNANSKEAIVALQRIWYDAHPEDTDKVEHQSGRCGDLGSPWVLHQTVSVDEVYDVGAVLGTPGQYGTVKEATSRDDGTKVAIKFLKKHKYSDEKRTMQYFKDLRTEIYLLDAAKDHPYIIDLGDSSGHAIFEDIEHLYIVMEHCSGGELYDRIQELDGFSEKHAQDLIRQMVSALYYLHSQGIAHCDLKPENFVFKSRDKASKDYNTLKMIDFGMAKVVHWRKYLRKLVGTPYYIAPECLAGRYNEACDMWSIGVVMFVMIFGFPPFYDDQKSRDRMSSDEIIFAKIRKGFEPKIKSGYGAWFPKDHKVSHECRDLLGRLLRKSIADRLTAEEVLEHPWLTSDATQQELMAINDRQLLKAIRSYSRANKFQHEILHLLNECKYLSKNQLSTIQETFSRIDENGDGILTLKEVEEGLKRIDPHITSQEVDSIFKAIDANRDGKIDYSEILSMRINKKLESKEARLRKVFQALDKNQDGVVTPDELAAALDSVHEEKVTTAYAQELISLVDSDKDGKCSYEEFIRVWDRSQQASRVESFVGSPAKQSVSQTASKLKNMDV